MWDDETCLRFAEAYDREDAAQRGEPSPHADKSEGYAEWAAERVACVRAGLAFVPAPAVPDDVAELVRDLRAEANEGRGWRMMDDAADTIEAQAAELARLRAAITDALGRYQVTHIHEGLRAALTQPTGD